MIAARHLLPLVALPAVLLGCAAPVERPTLEPTATPGSTIVFVPASELPHPPPEGQLFIYMQTLARDLDFTCSLESAFSCVRRDGSVELTVDVSATPNGRVEALHVVARATDPALDVRAVVASMVGRFGAIARPLLRTDVELADVDAAIRDLLADPTTSGDPMDLPGGRLVLGARVEQDDSGPGEDVQVIARLQFTDVLAP